MGFNSAFKGLKLLKTTGNGRLNNLNNLNDPVLNVLTWEVAASCWLIQLKVWWCTDWQTLNLQFGHIYQLILLLIPIAVVHIHVYYLQTPNLCNFITAYTFQIISSKHVQVWPHNNWNHRALFVLFNTDHGLYCRTVHVATLVMQSNSCTIHTLTL